MPLAIAAIHDASHTAYRDRLDEYVTEVTAPLDDKEHIVNTGGRSSAKKPIDRGQWTRWGRGMCEGWSLEIGMAFRGSVVRRDNDLNFDNIQQRRWDAPVCVSAGR
jgi:hypothetical protein